MTTPAEQRDIARAELVRSRAFLRGAETQLTKALDALDAIDLSDPAPTPEPEPPVVTPGDDPVYVPEPGETVAQMLRSIKVEGMRKILLPSGDWELGETSPDWKRSGPGQDAEVVIEAMPGHTPTLFNPAMRSWRPYTNILYRGVRVDWQHISQFYDGVVGFENCEWFSSAGWLDPANRTVPVRGGYYAKNCTAHDMLYAFTGANLVEDCHAYNVSGDVFQGSKIVRNCTADNIDGSVRSHHTDIFQVFGASDGITWENVTATNLKDTQVFMLESFIGKPPEDLADFDPSYTIRNLTVRNVTADCAIVAKDDNENWGGPPFSHMMGFFEDCLFENVKAPNQRMIVRNQNGRGGCRNVVFRGCEFHPGSSFGQATVE